MNPIQEKVCPSCSAVFDCGGSCWCNQYPPIIAMDPDSNQGCLCESCLSSTIIEHIESYMEDLTDEKKRQIKKLEKPSKLINGIDYTVNQQGRLVFSKWYLLRRGYCCDYGCQNCPYKT